MKKAYCYSRVSSAKQIEKDRDGMARQIRLAEQWAQENGYTLETDSFFRDANKSAFTGANLKSDSALSAFLAAVDGGEIPPGSVLCIENLDRLTRSNILSAQKLFMSVLERGIEIVTVIDRKRFTLESVNASPMDLIQSLLLFDAAHRYSKDLRRRVAEKWQQKRESGAKTKNVHPSWIQFDRKNDKFNVIESKADVIREIFKLYLSGLGYSSIARKLNENKTKTLTNKNNWSSGMVKVLLKSPLVIGEYHAYKTGDKKNQKIETGIVHKNYYPPIISVEIWNNVKERMILNVPHIGPGRPKKDFVDLFEGLIKCGYCDGTMGVRDGKILVCWKGRYGGCINVGWEIQDYEETLFFQVYEAIESRIKELKSPDNIELTKLQQEILLLTDKIQKATELLLDLPSKELKQKYREMIHQRSEKENQLTSMVKQTDEKTEVDLAYEMLKDEDERRNAARHIRKHLDKIEVFSVGDEVEEFKKIREQYRSKGIIGYPSITRARKQLNWDKTRYFKVYPKTRECFKVIPSRVLKINYEQSSPPSSEFIRWAAKI